jgi:hypothetical protein
MVRQVSSKEIIIANPLAIPASFTTICSTSEITAPHTLTLPPRSEGSILLEYLPLHVKDIQARLIVTSNELGVYQYDLKLLAVPANPERSLHFKVGLGGSQTQMLRFTSYAKIKTEYTCKLDNSDFITEKSIIVLPTSSSANGVEVSLEVQYEPCKIGDVKTQLIVSSPNGGDYIFPLIGHCVAPRPQGPVLIKSGIISNIQFKNVFNCSTTFTITADNPSFIVKTPSETAPPKKSFTIQVFYRHTATASINSSNLSINNISNNGTQSKDLQNQTKNDKKSITPQPTLETSTSSILSQIPSSSLIPPVLKVGKLTVSHPSGVSWIYHLKGTL